MLSFLLTGVMLTLTVAQEQIASILRNRQATSTQSDQTIGTLRTSLTVLLSPIGGSTQMFSFQTGSGRPRAGKK